MRETYDKFCTIFIDIYETSKIIFIVAKIEWK